MGIELVLKLRSDSLHLNTVGAVYARPHEDGESPKVTDVLVRNTRASRFVLAPGPYEYRFFVRAGSGRYKLSLSAYDGDLVLQAKEFDTEIATHGVIFRFDVPEKPAS